MNQTSEGKIFQHTKMIYTGRYYSVLLWVIGWDIVYPVWLKGLSYLPIYIYGVFFEDPERALIFLSLPFFWIIFSLAATANNVFFLEIKDNFLLVTFFGFLKKKSLKLNYADISSLEWSQDSFKNFVFNLKNGEKKLIKTEIVDRKKAFDIIQQKIKEFKNL